MLFFLEDIKSVVSFFREVQKELLERQRARCADAVGTKLIFKHMVSFVEELAKEVYQSDVVNRLEALETAERKTRVVLCRRVFRQWMAVYK